ncbi:MAG: glycosyltransferase family 2 protein [Candidatus Rifleibacteriota bacterium]
MKMTQKTCLIIPCHNEEKNLPLLFTEIAKLEDETLIPLVIDDCSVDNSAKMAIRNNDVIVLQLPVNLGVGGAVQTGLIFALENNMNYAIKLDGDGQHPPDQIEKLLNALNQNEADIIVGSRFLQNEEKGFKSTFTRRMGISFLQKVCKLLTGQQITDPTSGFRAYNRKAIEFMAEHYPSFDYPEPEEIILAVKNNLRIKEVPVIMRERQHGKSSISAGNSIYYMIKVTLAMFFTAIRKKEKFLKQQ